MAKAKRTAFYFPEEAAVRLQKIKKRARLDNSANVVRAALSAYDELLEVALAGCTIVVKDREGQEWPYSPYTRFSYPGLARKTEPIAAISATEKSPKNFAFSEAAVATLESIRKRSYLESNADVIRAALAAYDELTTAFSAGDQIIIRDTEDNECTYTPYAPLTRQRLNLSGTCGINGALAANGIAAPVL